MSTKIYQNEILTNKVPSTSFLGVLLDGYTYRSLAYVLLLFPVSIIWFTYVVTLTSLSLGLMITIFGIPISYFFFLSLPRLLSMQGALAEKFTGVQMPVVQEKAPQGNIFEKTYDLLARSTTHTTILYGLMILPLGIFYFTYTVASLALSISLMLVILYPLVRAILLSAGVDVDDSYMNYISDWIPEWVLLLSISIIGFFMLVVTLHGVREIAKFDAKLLKRILSYENQE